MTRYRECVARLSPLLRRVKPMNDRISDLRTNKPVHALGNGDPRWPEPIGTLKQLAMPDPDKPHKLLWPEQRRVDYSATVPIMGHPGDQWWKVQQAAIAQQRAEDAKRAEELAQEEGRIRADPKLWKGG